MKILVDIGNTNIKVSDGKDKYIITPTKQITSVKAFEDLIENNFNISEIEKIIVCSVVPTVKEHVIKFAKMPCQCQIVELTHDMNFGIKIGTDVPTRTGMDLIAIAALINSKTNDGVLVNLGTATTIVKVKDGVFEGAIIMPGIISSFEGLVNNAANLSCFVLKPSEKIVGTNTEDAISIGIVNAHAEAIKGLVGKMNVKDVYISGGNSVYIKDLVPYTYIKQATIQGMKEIEKAN